MGGKIWKWKIFWYCGTLQGEYFYLFLNLLVLIVYLSFVLRRCSFRIRGTVLLLRTLFFLHCPFFQGLTFYEKMKTSISRSRAAQIFFKSWTGCRLDFFRNFFITIFEYWIGNDFSFSFKQMHVHACLYYWILKSWHRKEIIYRLRWRPIKFDPL